MDSADWSPKQKAEIAISCAEKGGWAVRVDVGGAEFLSFPVLIRIEPTSNIVYTSQVGGCIGMTHPEVRGYMVPLMPTKNALAAHECLLAIFHEAKDEYTGEWWQRNWGKINRNLDLIQPGMRLSLGGERVLNHEAWLYVDQYGCKDLPCVLTRENSD